MLVHCALGINRSAAVCVAYMMLERRLPLLAVTRLIKDRRRIVLANKAFQRQLVSFARARGLLGELPSDEQTMDDKDTDDDRLSATVRRLTLHDRTSNGVDWRLNGLHVDLSSTGHRLDTYRSRHDDDWHSSTSRADDDGRGFTSTSARYYFTGAGDFSPRRKSSSRGMATRSRETDDVTPSYVSPRQYRTSKSATSFLPVSGGSTRQTRPPSAVHSRSRSASRFSLGFI